MAKRHTAVGGESTNDYGACAVVRERPVSRPIPAVTQQQKRITAPAATPGGAMAERIPAKDTQMAASIIPHFHNTPGVRVVHVGSREFMCIGALPPFDHPHIYIDMGHDSEVVCSYCSTLYRFDPALAEGTAKPVECVWHDQPAEAPASAA
ncbi:putative Zn-finger protein [Pseudochelatococcus contaminans]|uniref:Putative Zn-finger protein n=2 Tax=Pseudochelatococcus contaminans TaxID=1538103 RepID=A0A7W5Z0Y8_9HYPH|nr:putative Zn-finger protein [Pseudochelatococcus contaminans]